MKKRLDVRDLKLGMYVFALDRPWLETPFIFQGFRLTTEEQLQTLRQYSEFVDIDTDLTREPPVVDSDAGPAEEPVLRFQNEQDRKRLEFEVLRAQANPLAQEQTYPDQVDVNEEIPFIQDAHDDSIALMHGVFEDAQKKRNIDTAGVKISVGRLADSVIRNPDALMLFSQIKNKDEYTAQHCLRVCILALTLGRQMGMRSEEHTSELQSH